MRKWLEFKIGKNADAKSFDLHTRVDADMERPTDPVVLTMDIHKAVKAALVEAGIMPGPLNASEYARSGEGPAHWSEIDTEALHAGIVRATQEHQQQRNREVAEAAAALPENSLRRTLFTAMGRLAGRIAKLEGWKRKFTAYINRKVNELDERQTVRINALAAACDRRIDTLTSITGATFGDVDRYCNKLVDRIKALEERPAGEPDAEARRDIDDLFSRTRAALERVAGVEERLSKLDQPKPGDLAQPLSQQISDVRALARRTGERMDMLAAEVNRVRDRQLVQAGELNTHHCKLDEIARAMGAHKPPKLATQKKAAAKKKPAAVVSKKAPKK